MNREIKGLIYDWSEHQNEYPVNLTSHLTKMHDESLRDGLQRPKLKEPSLDQRIELLRLMNAAGIDCANIGFPASSKKTKDMIKEIALIRAQEGWTMELMCAARLIPKDIEAITDITNQTGIRLWTGMFLAASELRVAVMNWDINEMAERIVPSIRFARDNGLPVMFVTEDSSRAHPENIKLYNQTAIDAGAKRLCITDTVGYASAQATRKLVGFVKHEIIKGQEVDGKVIELEWHGHNHLGLALSNTIEAVRAGADRIEGTLLGKGEMCGNCPLELYALNANVKGGMNYDLKKFYQLCLLYAESTGDQIPENWPLVGVNAFTVGSGVHADAYLKGISSDRQELANYVYSAYSPDLVGREIDADLNPMSGEASVRVYLLRRGISNSSPEIIESILAAVKGSATKISEKQILSFLEKINAGRH